MTKKQHTGDCRNYFTSIFRCQQQIAFKHFVRRIPARDCLLESITFKLAQEAPQVRFIYVRSYGTDHRHVFKSDRSGFVDQGREFFARSLSLIRSDSHVETSVFGSVWSALPFYSKRHNTAAVIKSYAIDERNQRGLDVFPA